MKSPRLLAATVALSSVAWLGLAAPATAAVSHESNASADWLAGEVQSTGLLATQWGPDHGMTVDGMLTLAALGGQEATVTQMADGLAATVGDYTTGEAFGDVGSVYAGASGKLTTALLSVGRDVSNVAGVDLGARLEGTIVTSGADTGRGVDVSEWGDYSNTIGQSWIVRGLVGIESELAPDAVEFLLAQQCDDGGFRLGIGGTACDGGVDATAYALVALEDAKQAGVTGSSTSELDSSIAAASGHLVNRQESDGSFNEGWGANSNSVGLASWALRTVGQGAAADAAADWLRENTWIRPSGAMAAEGGAIGYDVTTFTNDVTAGALADRSQWLRATAQAAMAWVGASDRATPYEATVDVATEIEAGEDFTITAEGFEAGESVIIDLSGAGSVGDNSFAALKFAVLDVVTADAAGAVSHTATAPETPGDYTLTVSSDTASGSTAVTVNGSTGGSTGGDDGGSTGGDTGGDTGDDTGDDTGSSDSGDTTDETTDDAGDGTLPNSGSDTGAGWLAAGAALVVAGAGALFLVRRRERAEV